MGAEASIDSTVVIGLGNNYQGERTLNIVNGSPYDYEGPGWQSCREKLAKHS